MLAWYMYDEIDYMVENGHWIDNRYEAPYELDSNQESSESLESEAFYYFNLDCIAEQDAIEAAQGPMPRPDYLPELGAPWTDEIPF